MMARMKDNSNDLRVATAVVYQSGKGYKTTSKQLDIIDKWKTFRTAASVPRSERISKLIQRSDRAMLRETAI